MESELTQVALGDGSHHIGATSVLFKKEGNSFPKAFPLVAEGKVDGGRADGIMCRLLWEISALFSGPQLCHLLLLADDPDVSLPPLVTHLLFLSSQALGGVRLALLQTGRSTTCSSHGDSLQRRRALLQQVRYGLRKSQRLPFPSPRLQPEQNQCCIIEETSAINKRLLKS